MSRRLIGAFLIGIAVAASAACGGSKSTTSPEATSAVSSVPFDRAFIDAMVPHHQSAIAMASAAKTAGLSDPELTEIAGNIISSQQREIDEMRDWRQDWFGSRDRPRGR
jgi:uncharacterized protein (DUF305 family)